MHVVLLIIIETCLVRGFQSCGNLITSTFLRGSRKSHSRQISTYSWPGALWRITSTVDGDIKVCSVAVLLIFLCGVSVNEISPCGVAVISKPAVYDVCVFKHTVCGETRSVWFFCLTFVTTKFSLILCYHIDCLAYITYGHFSLFMELF